MSGKKDGKQTEEKGQKKKRTRNKYLKSDCEKSVDNNDASFSAGRTPELEKESTERDGEGNRRTNKNTRNTHQKSKRNQDVYQRKGEAVMM